MNSVHRLAVTHGVLLLGVFGARLASATEWSGAPAQPTHYPPPESPASDTPPATTERASHEKEHFRIGVLGGVGFPRPLAVEALFKLERTLALGVEYSALPTIGVLGVDARAWAVQADARLFPFQNAFFLGVRAGRQHVNVNGALAYRGYQATESLAVDTTFVNPELGFLFTAKPGFTIGMAAGAQIPLSTSSSNSLPAGSVANAEVNRVATFYGNKVIPTIDLLRIGFLL